MELDDIKDAQLHLLANPQPCVLPVTLPPALLDEILADADISMRLEFSDAGHVRCQSFIFFFPENQKESSKSTTNWFP